MSAYSNHEAPEECKPSKKHNDLVFSYYDDKCKRPSTLLESLSALSAHSPANTYNQSVLHYYEESYGAALSLLNFLMTRLDSLDYYLSFKTCFLHIQCCISLSLIKEIGESIEILDNLWMHKSYLKEAPEHSHFTPLMLGTWMGSPQSPDLCESEFSCIFRLFKCKLALLNSEGELARHEVAAAEEFWKKLDRAHYSPEIFVFLETQFLASKHYLMSEITYIEGNMNLALQSLNQAQLEILPILGDRKSHPTCLRTAQRISHPVYFYNNLGCIHIRLGKPRLARLYFNRAYESFSNKQSIDTKLKECTVSYYSSVKRAELLYNSALALLNSKKPDKALECLKEIAGLYYKQPLFWYRMAQCYCSIHLKELELGRLDMLSDIVVSEAHNKIHLPAKAIYKFQDAEENSAEDSVEQAIKCLRNALSLCEDNEDLRMHILLLLSYCCMGSQPQCTLSSAQQLLHMDVSERQRFVASLYASEALLSLGKPRQAIEYLSAPPRELKLLCHSTLSPTAAVFTEEVSSRYVQSINLVSAHLHAGNYQQAQQVLNTVLTLITPNLPDSEAALQFPIPAPVLNLAIYMALKMGNHKQAEELVRTRWVYPGFVFARAEPRTE